MKRTMIWPPEVAGGRVAMTADPAVDSDDPGRALRQIIRIGVQDATSTNPWITRQNLGIKDPTFQRATSASEALITERVRVQFRGLERARRAKLASVAVRHDRPTSTRTVRIEYDDLELGTRESLEVAGG